MPTPALWPFPPHHRTTAMILNDDTIRHLVKTKGLISPWPGRGQLNGNSYDVTLAGHFISPTRGECFDHAQFTLLPGEVVLASTAEKVKLPEDVAAYLSLKSSIARQWINHAMAGWVYPLFEGNVTLELMNVGVEPYVLQTGMRIAQLTFMHAMAPVFKHTSSLPKHEGTVAAPKQQGDFGPHTVIEPTKT